MRKTILILSLFFAYSWCFAASTPQKLLSHSKQLIIISTTNWNSVSGQMQRFARDSTKHSWKAVGKPVPIVVGKQGMGWDLHIKKMGQPVIKHEGDNLTPVGVYAIGPTFGFDEKNKNNKINYFPLTDKSICVDDVKSNYYNQLIDSANIPQKDWNSGEQMRQTPLYKLGAMVQYNTNPVTPGAGSCIFLHIWRSPILGTAGCIAMEEYTLQETLSWLNARKNPVIAIFPMQIYKNLRSEWKLPLIS
jgi:L,D-peptidoglycan transpeptidase YkuD (ErfK/YbiS/YcfS/YnhG family)